MIEAYIDGVSFASLGLGLIRRDIPVLPDTRDYNVVLSGTDGELDFGSEYGPRMVPHECVVMAEDPTLDYHRKIAQIARFFNAKKGDSILTYSDLPGRRYKMRYSGTLPIEKLIFDGMVTIPMKMHSPFPESDERVLETTIITSPKQIIVVSDGDVRASPVITITNTGTTTIEVLKFVNEFIVEE